MKISVAGTGYVGLVSGTCFSETGISVTCVDINKDKIKKLNQGIVTIYEPGLEKMIERNVKQGRLFFTSNLKESLKDCEAIFITVGTPSGEDGSIELKDVLSVAREIGRNMDHPLVIITKSTVPLGTTIKVKDIIQEELDKRKVKISFEVASNPEFLKEGNAIDDFLKPDRIIVGTDSEGAVKIIKRLYKPFLLNGHPIIYMDIHSAELTKYAANAMLATRISFMNDIANLCELIGADINLIRKGIGSDNRIGNKFIYPGVGYGGSCFPKDVKALIKTADESGYSLEILKSVEDVNERQKFVIFNKIHKHFNGHLKGKIFGLWGLSFKPHTNDMRQAPSIIVIEKLLSEGAKIKAYDPVAMNECYKKIGNRIEYVKDQYEALINANALILMTEWPEFRVLNFKVLEKLMNNKTIFDGRNIYEPSEMKEFGFTYYSIGRKTVK